MSIECTIRTPQFEGNQYKYWLKEQSGIFDTVTLLFTPHDSFKNDQGKIGRHMVSFHNRDQFDKFRIA